MIIKDKYLEIVRGRNDITIYTKDIKVMTILGQYDNLSMHEWAFLECGLYVFKYAVNGNITKIANDIKQRINLYNFLDGCMQLKEDVNHEQV